MNLIVAVEKNRGIGMKGSMPWHISADLKYFKEKTTGKTVIMGRKTLLSFPNKKPLPNRENIILSTDKNYSVDGASVINSIDALADIDISDAFVIGGGGVYNQLIDYCKYAYVTHIDASYECDTFFKDLSANDDWELIQKGEMLEENGISFCFCIYENKNVKSFDKKDLSITDYNNENLSIKDIDPDSLSLLMELEDEFDADVKISLLRSCGIMAFKRYPSYSAVAKIYCGSSNLGVSIYVSSKDFNEAKAILDAPFEPIDET